MFTFQALKYDVLYKAISKGNVTFITIYPQIKSIKVNGVSNPGFKPSCFALIMTE